MSRPEVLATVSALATEFGNATFTPKDAERVGVAQHRLWSAVGSGVVYRLARGRYQVVGEHVGLPPEGIAIPSVEAARVRDRIAEFAEDGVPAILGNASASQAWQLPLYQVEPPPHPVLLVPRQSGLKAGVRRGIRISLRDVDPQQVVLGPGEIPMTNPLLTALHIAAGPRLALPGRLVVLHGGLRRHWELLEGDGARTDPLGATGPRIKVQVKRRTDKANVDSLRSFLSLLGPNDVGLFVNTGGFTSEAEREARSQESRRLTLQPITGLVFR